MNTKVRNTNVPHMVTTRVEHICCMCGRRITVGEKAKTRNSRRNKRTYTCMQCVRLRRKDSVFEHYTKCSTYRELEADIVTAFDDEAAYDVELDHKGYLQSRDCTNCVKTECPYSC